MSSGNILRQVESQAQSGRLCSCDEGLEEGGEPLRRETRSCMAHGEGRPWSIRPSLDVDLYCDRCLLGCVFDAICQHILQQLAQSIGVSREDYLHRCVEVDGRLRRAEGSNDFLH